MIQKWNFFRCSDLGYPARPPPRSYPLDAPWRPVYWRSLGLYIVLISRRNADPSGQMPISVTQRSGKSLSFSTIKTVSSDATISIDN